MDRVIYVAMTGAKHTMRANQANTNNLANINTTGFRADLTAFQSRPIEGAGYPSRINAVAETDGADFSQGSLITTGQKHKKTKKNKNKQTKQAADDSKTKTHTNKHTLNSSGMLLTKAGQPV